MVTADYCLFGVVLHLVVFAMITQSQSPLSLLVATELTRDLVNKMSSLKSGQTLQVYQVAKKPLIVTE